MKRLVLLALTGVLSLPVGVAEARRSCGHGKIYRVSLGICVGARSHLAQGYVRARRTIRYGHHSRRYWRFARLQQEEEDQADERERRIKIKPPPVLLRHRPQMLQVVEPPPPSEEAAEVPYVIDMPFGIWGSRMMRPPSQPYWRLP